MGNDIRKFDYGKLMDDLQYLKDQREQARQRYNEAKRLFDAASNELDKLQTVVDVISNY